MPPVEPETPRVEYVDWVSSKVIVDRKAYKIIRISDGCYVVNDDNGDDNPSIGRFFRHNEIFFYNTVSKQSLLQAIRRVWIAPGSIISGGCVERMDYVTRIAIAGKQRVVLGREEDNYIVPCSVGDEIFRLIKSPKNKELFYLDGPRKHRQLIASICSVWNSRDHKPAGETVPTAILSNDLDLVDWKDETFSLAWDGTKGTSHAYVYNNTRRMIGCVYADGSYVRYGSKADVLYHEECAILAAIGAAISAVAKARGTAVNTPPVYIAESPKPTTQEPIVPSQEAAHESAFDAILIDTADAATRTAGRQLLKLTKEPLVALLCRNLSPGDDAFRAKLATFLETDLGEALFAQMLSLALQALPSLPGATTIGRELRVQAMAGATDVLADLVMEPLRQVLATTLQGTPPIAATLGDGIRAVPTMPNPSKPVPTSSER